MKKLFALVLFALLALASIPLIAGSDATAKASDQVATWELVEVSASANELGFAQVHSRLQCSWVCEDGSTGTCFPPDLETCLDEANSACGDTEAD